MESLIKLLYKTADDQLILGHRNSEWTGIGPTLEEDIAFSSMSQDKIGHAYAIYQILNDQLGEDEPDTIAFNRAAKDFTCAQFVELPIGEFDFSLVRHFLFDHAESIRFHSFANSQFEPLAQLSNKVKGEIKYHIMHANAWIKQLGNGSEIGKARIQSAINYAMPFALGMFESFEGEEELLEESIYIGEKAIYDLWANNVSEQIKAAGFNLPSIELSTAINGGRAGYHTEHLQPLLTEMTEVFKLDPTAEW